VILADLPMVEVHHFRGAKWVSLLYMDYCPPLPAARPDEERLTFALRLASATVGVRKVEARTAPLRGTSAVNRTALAAIPGDRLAALGY
jgi:hypothetical protein